MVIRSSLHLWFSMPSLFKLNETTDFPRYFLVPLLIWIKLWARCASTSQLEEFKFFLTILERILLLRNSDVSVTYLLPNLYITYLTLRLRNTVRYELTFHRTNVRWKKCCKTCYKISQIINMGNILLIQVSKNPLFPFF